MSGARSRRLRGSLGDSWGDAEYSSDGGASIHSTYSLSDAGSESEYDLHGESREQQDIATPLPSRVTRTRSRTPQDTPVKTPASRAASGRSTHSQRSTPRSFQSTPESLEPSFIMPSMSGDNFYNGSPLRNSQLRIRKARQPSTQSQPGSMTSSPQIKSRRTSTFKYQPQAVQQEPEEVGPWYYVDLFRAHVLWPIVQYLLGVFRYAMVHFMQPIFATALAVFLLVAVIHMAGGFLQRTVQTALTPVCIIPGSSYLLPFCSTTSHEDRYADFENLVNVQNTFEDVLEANKDSYALPATMKKGEMAIRDLRSLVKYSRLPSRNELEVEFTAFIDTAREASDQLAKYNGKVGFTMDQVISTNKWTLAVLEGIGAQESSTGSLSRALSYINPLSLIFPGPESLDQRIFEQYVLHVAKTKEDITRLIENSEALLALLNNLENRLDIIADVAYRDDLIVSKDRDALLSLLWTKLGGNRSSKKSFDSSLRLLNEVLRYKKVAVEHVTATLLKLQEMAAALENLRDGVAAPELVGYRGGDVPLQWHIEVVGKSVERLRDVRGETLAIEREVLRKGLGEDGESKGLPGKHMPTVYAKTGRD